MEEQNVKSKIWKHTILYSVLIITLFASFGFLIYSLTNRDKEIKSLRNDLETNRNEKSSCLFLRDSLKRENARLYVYKTLTKAMVHRDEAVGQLKYGIGDVVILKVDSSRVVIQDVVIGGGKFEYYIKYSVIHKDRHIEIVSPELIY